MYKCVLFSCVLFLDSALFKLIHARFAGAYVCVCRYLAIANRLFPGKSDHILRPTKHETPQSEQVSKFLYIGQNVS